MRQSVKMESEQTGGVFADIQRRKTNKRNAIITSVVGITAFLVAMGMFYFNVPGFVYREYLPFVAAAVAVALGLYRYVAFRLTGR